MTMPLIDSTNIPERLTSFTTVNLLIFKEKIYLCNKQKGNDNAASQ